MIVDNAHRPPFFEPFKLYVIGICVVLEILNILNTSSHFSSQIKLWTMALNGRSIQADEVTVLMRALLDENVALEHLNLQFPYINSNEIKTIVKFKTLKTLKLFGSDCESEDDVVSLTNELPLLTELR